jgi:repressor of nif and glnA expression
MAAKRRKTAWGTTLGTGAAAIEQILRIATRPLSEREIEGEIRGKGIEPRGAISSHLNALKRRGHIVKTAFGWARVKGGGRQS